MKPWLYRGPKLGVCETLLLELWLEDGNEIKNHLQAEMNLKALEAFSLALWSLYTLAFTSHKPEAVVCSVKKVFLKISQNSQQSNCARVSFFNKVSSLTSGEPLAQVLSCKFCEIFKNRFFYKTTPVAAFDKYLCFCHSAIKSSFTFSFLSACNIDIKIFFLLSPSKSCFVYRRYFIKVRPSPSKKKCVICFIESPLKMMKNAYWSRDMLNFNLQKKVWN